jgi:hypothetical protein
MPLEVRNIQHERIGGLHVNPSDDPHDWFTVGLYGTDTGEPALGFQLHDTTERPPDGVTPEGRGDLLLDGAARVRTPARSAWPKRHPQVFLNAAALTADPLHIPCWPSSAGWHTAGRRSVLGARHPPGGPGRTTLKLSAFVSLPWPGLHGAEHGALEQMPRHTGIDTGKRLDRAPGRTAGRWRLDDLRLPHLPRARPLVPVSQPGQLAAVANAAEHELPAQDCRKPARRRVLNAPVAIQTIPALLRRRRQLVAASVERFRSSGEHTGLSAGRAHGITSRIAHRGSSGAHQ